MEREASTALQRAVNIEFAAQLASDWRAVGLAQNAVESTWQLVRGLSVAPRSTKADQ